MKPPSHPSHRQRGAALLLAMVVLTLVSTMAAGMVWQQWRAVQVEGAERSRTQATWLLTGALDWGRLILREDARTGGPDSLDEIWATPLQETRLSTFLAQDKDHNADADSGPEAFLSGSIRDAQARLNLRNLIVQGKVVEAQLEVLKRLCESAQVPVANADLIAAGLLAAWPVAGASSGATGSNSAAAPLAPHSVRQLAWLGVDTENLRRLHDFIVLLPTPTPVNLNTAPREVIAAVLNIDAGSAERLVQDRQNKRFATIESVRPYIGADAKLDAQQVAISSRYFEVSGRLRLDGRVIEERSLIERRGLDMVQITRERRSVVSTVPAG